jgi:hypothetical protein
MFTLRPFAGRVHSGGGAAVETADLRSLALIREAWIDTERKYFPVRNRVKNLRLARISEDQRLKSPVHFKPEDSFEPRNTRITRKEALKILFRSVPDSVCFVPLKEFACPPFASHSRNEQKLTEETKVKGGKGERGNAFGIHGTIPSEFGFPHSNQGGDGPAGTVPRALVLRAAPGKASAMAKS